MKAFDLVPGGDMAHEVQMDAAEPLFVVREGRGLHLVIDPALADLLIDEGDDGITGTGAGRFLDPRLFSFGLFFLGVRPGFVGRRGKSRGGQQGADHQENERKCAEKERTKPARRKPIAEAGHGRVRHRRSCTTFTGDGRSMFAAISGDSSTFRPWPRLRHSCTHISYDRLRP